jgi:uncharacterized protein (DUF2147 family)
MKKIMMVSLVILFVINLFSFTGNEIVGKWLTENGKSIIKIEKIDDSFQGKIIWLKEPIYPKDDKNAGKEKMDIHNPDKNKRTNKLVGLKLLWGFHFKKDKWIGGKIYDPESGKTYFCKIQMDKSGNLKIKGSIDKWGMIGRSTVWEKVSKEDERGNK